uniref:Uncharacterized protein n=1 Tax=Nelumbo nucifera TaxID=4432 RepID=A0A822YVF9_NELNU|nr:TPA_asm: hypothetical protein HUJ06_006190 [Nelumbo nucifera]
MDRKKYKKGNSHIYKTLHNYKNGWNSLPIYYKILFEDLKISDRVFGSVGVYPINVVT